MWNRCISGTWRPCLLALGLFMAVGCGGGDDGPSGPTEPTDTAVTRTAAGWAHFEAGRWDDAVAEFQAALALDPTHGPAHGGLGWARLQLALTPVAMEAASTHFSAAIASGEAGADVLAGRASARLGAGGLSLPGAVSDAVAALESSPLFQFARRSSFDVRDLRLLVAAAWLAQGDLDAALAMADQISASGIDPQQSSTWQVGGVTLPTYAAAVLAHLHALSEEFSG